MKRASNRLWGISLLSGLCAAALSWHGLKGIAPDAAARPESILVFRRAVEAGTVLKSGDVSWADWPGSAVSGGMIRRAAGPVEVEGAVIPASFRKGDPVPRGLLESLPFNLGLRPGFRAVPIRISDDATARLLRAGMAVDLIPAGEKRPGLRTRTLRNVRILSVRPAEGQRRHAVALAELTPAQAERIGHEATVGRIVVAFAGSSAQADGVKAAAPDAPRERSIVLIKQGAVASPSGPIQ